mmetsp:Transcript_26447/g.60223  ORF Transcript_26447/g.60223 Transcript_26447/m.60223 type:complete len:220 (-) Transcript_26447:2279-2938(-)
MYPQPIGQLQQPWLSRRSSGRWALSLPLHIGRAPRAGAGAGGAEKHLGERGVRARGCERERLVCYDPGNAYRQCVPPGACFRLCKESLGTLSVTNRRPRRTRGSSDPPPLCGGQAARAQRRRHPQRLHQVRSRLAHRRARHPRTPRCPPPLHQRDGPRARGRRHQEPERQLREQEEDRAGRRTCSSDRPHPHQPASGAGASVCCDPQPGCQRRELRQGD